MKYEVFEHVSDIGLHIYGYSFKELLENAGLALFDQMADLSRVSSVDAFEVSAQGDTVEELFMAWMRELLYIFHGKGYLFFHGEGYLLKEFVVEEASKGKIKGIAKGEKIDPDRHLIHGEVKGATYHRLEVKESGGKWEATVILDV
ncbi:MAG: archease [Deltaproteobacteria bacterium]|nr:archease [Deltaproteobacteria bacterium]